VTVPAISVVIPAFNAAAFICETLDSVRHQTRLSHEIIVVDDGSTDETPDRVSLWIEQYGSNCRLIRQQNRGVSAARNVGLQQATGDLVAFVDSDDILMPNHHERLSEPLGDDASIVVAFADQCLFDNTGTIVESFLADKPALHLKCSPLRSGWMIIRDNPALTLMRGNYVPTSGSMMSLQALRRIGGFRESLRTSEDRHAMIRLSRIGRFAFSRSMVARKRVHPASLTEGGALSAISLNALHALVELRNDPEWRAPSAEEAGALSAALNEASRDALYHASRLGLQPYASVFRWLISRGIIGPVLSPRDCFRAAAVSARQGCRRLVGA
jgi:Glycosyl transferase family 2